MRSSRNTVWRAAMFAVFFSLFLLPSHMCLGQGGPPPLPPFPVSALGFYPLEMPPWVDWFGEPASGFTNLNVAPSWDYAGTVLSVDTNVQAYLNYDVFQYGSTNIVFDNGSISLWFQPDWTSVADGGTGPTNWATLLSVGNWTSNAAASAWTIAISPSGTNLVMEAQSNGVNQVVFDVPLDFDAGDWHSITITYSLTNCGVYLEGQFVTNMGPIGYYPSGSDCTNYGFFVGSLSTSGNCQCHGQLQWLTTYDFPLSADEVAANYSDVSAYIRYFGGSVAAGGFHTDAGPPGSFGGSSTNGGGYYTADNIIVPDYTLNSPTNYALYTNFWLAISNSPTNIQVTVESTLSNLTYLVLTNNNLAGSNGWGIWQVLLATNNVTPAPPLALGTNTLFFEGVLVGSTTTNGFPDWWAMEYFRTLNVNPYADADGDGLCNLDEYVLGLNPTNAHTLSSLHTDAQALVLAYTNDLACHYQLSITNGPNTNTLLVTMSPTVVGTNYQIYSQASTNGAWIVETNFLGTNTATTVAIYKNGRTLSLIGGYGEDSDGDSLPDGYEVLATHTDPFLPDTGLTGISDAYKDPDGDGYVNIVEYYNGTDPLVFNPPAGPLNLVADVVSGGSTETISWQAATGPVVGYVIYNGNGVPVATNSPSQLSSTVANVNSGSFGVQAIYTNGTSGVNYGGFGQHAALAQAALVHGPGGQAYLVLSGATSNVVGYNIDLTTYAESYPETGDYNQCQNTYPSNLYQYQLETNFYIPASQFSNGVVELTEAQCPLYMLWPSVYVNPQLEGGSTGAAVSATGPFVDVPFIDGTEQMKQNVRFLLRAAGFDAFGYSFPLGCVYQPYSVTFPENYVYSALYSFGQLNHFQPFEDNYFYCNFVFNSSLVDVNGYLDTGFSYWFLDENYSQTGTSRFAFPTYDYVTFSNQMSIPGVISSNQTPWVGYFWGGNSGESFGVYVTNGSLAMSGGVPNLYGLPYTSLELTLSNSSIEFATLSPTNDVAGYTHTPFYLGTPFYVGTPQPQLETVGYYFVASGFDYPGSGSFTVNDTSPLIVGSVGNPLVVYGFAKQAVLNGYTNVFAYSGQYFTNAFVISNAVVTTNPAGIVSEYGELFPEVPGQVALMTKPDPDQTNIQGTCQVDVIRLSLDVNHDGTMNESFTGPDNAGPGAPYVFWANNDYDRWTYSLLDGNVEDDVESNSVYAASPYAPTLSVPDCEYRATDGGRVIPCVRDLEDFARLWVSGVSNTLSRLPSGSTVTLNWGDVGNPDWNANNPTIDIFQAADTNGGIGYLTNLTTASNQINNALCQYIGRLGPGSNILLNASTFSNNWAGDHYIFCGVGNGLGTLYLTVADGSGNTLAQSSQTIQIEDIKQMYERWTVGDNDKNVTPFTPMTVPVQVEDGQPTCQYSYDPAYDTNDDYVLFVHGYNMASWEKDRFAETAYKRLYWQGYQGRFGEFRWPTFNRFTSYDTSETEAWNSALGLGNLLTNLNRLYPGNVYVLGHSMGNVVTGEALRLAGTNKIVNTYAASQAAVSARAYDNTIPPDITNQFLIVTTPDSEGHYYTNGAPPYFASIAGAARFVDFYNPADWALRQWITDQNLKPDLGYGYETPSTNYPSGYWYKPYFAGNGIPLLFPTNTHQIFSRCAQSYSQALGAETNVADTFSFQPSVNLDAAPYNFLSTHPGHSEQFRFDNMTTTAYWRQLLVSYGLEP
jgi:hypothetical protein